MHIGVIGIGKMGMNMVERLLNHGHSVCAFDANSDALDIAVKKGADKAKTVDDLIALLPTTPKIVWLMLPAGEATDRVIEQLEAVLNPFDILIDGGNSFWKDSIKRNKRLAEKQIHFIDCGTSGGVWGLKNGYCLMYGGDKTACDLCKPIFDSLAQKDGALYCGISGSGHYTKMVHNAIEYGMMQSFAEGFELLKNAPLDLDKEKIANLWMHGSVIQSWLLELIALALKDDEDLSNIVGFVEDNGEARWAVQTAVEQETPFTTIAASLFARFNSRQDDSFAMKLLAAMRNQFGGHSIKSKI